MRRNSQSANGARCRDNPGPGSPFLPSVIGFLQEGVLQETRFYLSYGRTRGTVLRRGVDDDGERAPSSKHLSQSKKESGHGTTCTLRPARINAHDNNEVATIQVGPSVDVERGFTSDSKSLSIQYCVNDNEQKTSFPINVYRSDDDVTVEAQNPCGNLDWNYSGFVTLALASNPAGATLGGVLIAYAGGGMVTFPHLTIDKPGSGYTLRATAVDFGPLAATITSDNGTTIVVTSPASTTPVAVDITVTTAGGTSAPSAADQFTYVTSPTISSVSPALGTLKGGTSVTITGANLWPMPRRSSSAPKRRPRSSATATRRSWPSARRDRRARSM